MITAILEFFALGTLGFWALCTLVSIIFIACIENENYWFPTLVLAVFAGVYWKGLSSFALNWQSIGLGILIYSVIAVVWGMFRWSRFVKSIVNKYKDMYGNTLTKNNVLSLQREVSVTENKSLIVGWMAYWPWSMLWNVTGDFFKMIYENLEGVFKKISQRGVSQFKTTEDSR